MSSMLVPLAAAGAAVSWSTPEEESIATPSTSQEPESQHRSTTPTPTPSSPSSSLFSSSSSFFFSASPALSCAPSYTSFPLENEETVEINPRPGDLSSITTGVGRGTWTKKWKPMILTLRRQPTVNDDVQIQNPVYDRSGLVAGELEMKYPEGVLAVSVKLEGRITLSVAGVGAKLIRTVEEPPVVLWEKEQGSKRCCPGILLLSLRLPATFVDDTGEQRKLPPSFEPNYLDVSTVFVRSAYTLSISLERVVNCRLVSWIKRKTYDVLLEHRPRSRPSRPIPRFNSLFRSVKSVPDEWVQLVSKMEVQTESRLQAVDCHFFVPSNPTYCLSESIPFHIQISSSLGTLRELFPPSSHLLEPGRVHVTDGKAIRGQFSMQVYITREITVEIRRKKAFRTVTIGSGTLRAVPPTDLGGRSAPPDVCLDWEGEVKCWTAVRSGGFDVGCLSVKDYIMFAMTPPVGKNTEFVGLRVAHAVRFVTDGWVENGTVHPGEAGR